MNKLAERVLYLYVIGSLITTEVFALDLGFVHLGINRLLLPVLLLLCIARAVSDKENRLGRLTFPRQDNTYMLLFFVFWFCYAFLSLLWASDKAAWARGSFLLFTGITAVISFSLFTKSVDQIKTMLVFVTVFTMLHVFIGLNEMLTGNYQWLIPKDIAAHALNHCPASCFTGVNDYALVIVIGFYSALACVSFAATKRSRFWAKVSAVIFFAMCIATRSRANVMGVFLSGFVMSFFYKNARRTVRKIVLSALVAFFTLLVINVAFREFVIALARELFTVDTHSGGSDTIRLELIKNGFVFLKDHLLLGTGIGNIEYQMAEIGSVQGITNIHNWWMEILVSSGIFVFLGYLLFYGKLTLDMLRLSKKSDNSAVRGIAEAFFGFLIAFVIACISSSSNLGSEIVWTFFAIMIAFDKAASEQ